MNSKWFQIHVNPEPWAIGDVSVGRRNGKMIPIVGRNQALHAYKEAVREDLGDVELLPPGYILDFFFWRRLDKASDGNRRQHQADGTNMMKATEDALQGVLIGNDRDVIRATWTMMAQGPDVAPGVLVRVEWLANIDGALSRLNRQLYDEVMAYRPLRVVPDLTEDDNAWPPVQR